MDGASIRRVFTEAGDASADASQRIMMAGADAVLQLGWAIATTGAPVVVDLVPGMILPPVALRVAEWLAGLGRVRVTVATRSPNGGGRIEFLTAAFAAAWMQRLADAAVARHGNAAPGALRALAATWLDGDGRHLPSLAAMSMRRADPDTAMFALHTMGCIALRWAPRAVGPGGHMPGERVMLFDGKGGPVGVPSCVMIDPRALRKAPAAALAQRVASFPAHSIGFEWFDGSTWQSEMQTGATIGARIEALRRMLQEPIVPRGLVAADVETGFLMKAAQRSKDAAVALRIQAEWRGAGGAGADLGPLAERWSDLITESDVRAKLLRADNDGGMTFLRYSDGGRRFYSRDGDRAVLIGRGLDAVPNPRLAAQIVSTVRRLRREREAVLERVTGRSSTIFHGEIRADYWRLSLPLGADGRDLQGSLVLTGGFEISRVEQSG